MQLSGHRRMRRRLDGTSLSGTLPHSVGDMKALKTLCVCPPLFIGHARVGSVLYGEAGCRYRTGSPHTEGIGRHRHTQHVWHELYPAFAWLREFTEYVWRSESPHCHLPPIWPYTSAGQSVHLTRYSYPYCFTPYPLSYFRPPGRIHMLRCSVLSFSTRTVCCALEPGVSWFLCATHSCTHSYSLLHNRL